MAFPLAAIGAGLGMGAEQIERQRRQQLQMLLQRVALQREQQQNQAMALAGQALPGLAGRMGQGGMPQMQPGAGGIGTGLGGNPAVMPPPGATAPPSAPTPQGPMAGGRPTGVIPLDEGAASEAAADDRARQLGVPLDSEPPAAQPAGASLSAGGTTPAPAATTPGAGDSQAQLTNPLIQRLLGPTVDLKQISDAIQAARPGVDPGTAFRATQLVYDMLEKGSAQQQNAALRVLTQLEISRRAGASLSERAREADVRAGQGEQKIGIAQQQADTSAGRAATSAGSAAERARHNQVTEAASAARLQQSDARIKQAKGIADAGQRQRALRAVLQDVQKQLYPGLGMPQPDEATTARLKNQELEIQNELRKMSGMPPVQVPAEAAQPQQ